MPLSVTLTLRPNRRWTGFAAGQYVQLSVEIDGVLWTRCFSPCSSQHRADGRFQLTIKAHEDGRVSQHLYAHAAPGLVVALTPAGRDCQAADYTRPSLSPRVALSGTPNVDLR